jgi:hypothetical protein
MAGTPGGLPLPVLGFHPVVLGPGTCSPACHHPQVAQLPLFVSDGKWHHVCVTWTTRDGLWEAFQDGEKLGTGDSLAPWHPIKPGGVLILGQEQVGASWGVVRGALPAPGPATVADGQLDNPGCHVGSGQVWGRGQRGRDQAGVMIWTGAHIV